MEVNTAAPVYGTPASARGLGRTFPFSPRPLRRASSLNNSAQGSYIVLQHLDYILLKYADGVFRLSKGKGECEHLNVISRSPGVVSFYTASKSTHIATDDKGRVVQKRNPDVVDDTSVECFELVRVGNDGFCCITSTKCGRRLRVLAGSDGVRAQLVLGSAAADNVADSELFCDQHGILVNLSQQHGGKSPLAEPVKTSPVGGAAQIPRLVRAESVKPIQATTTRFSQVSPTR